MLKQPAIFSIAAGESFSDKLAEGLLQRYGDNPINLNNITLLLPTRRSIRAVSDGFLRQTNGHATLLPRMFAIGDLDEEELLLEPLFGDDLLYLPPAVTDLRRQLLLLHLVASTYDLYTTQAAPLARELADFLNKMQTENINFSALEDLVPADLATHWQETLKFLKLLTTPWQNLLLAENCMDPADRRNFVLEAQAKQWRQSPPSEPIIVAGSTGSIPATAELIKTVTLLPQGAVILPGLDFFTDEKTWAAIDESHAQYGMKQLLKRIGVDRTAVKPWLSDEVETPRQSLIREALRPAETTDHWRELPPISRLAVADLILINCADPIEEAGIIALSLRQALETPDRTAALITPDRSLARRVAAELKRWGIKIDDSAGLPLATTTPGSFLKLTAEMLGNPFEPINFLATLKHPLARCGQEAGRLKSIVREIDRYVLRGPKLAPGIVGLKAAIDASQQITAKASALLKDITRHSAEVLSLVDQVDVKLDVLLPAHVRFAEWLATDENGKCHLWDKDAGECAMHFMAELLTAATNLPVIPSAGYQDLLGNLMVGHAVRPNYGLHPRLNIWGPLEARLQKADLIVLGGLNEGTWPAAATADTWLSRPMTAQLGLPLPERRIGLSAHDFAQATSANEVILTRSAKVEGTPTVPSRWLLRLQQVLKATKLSFDQIAPEAFRDWRAKLDDPGPPQPIKPPECRPPIIARPRQLSVTQIETWIKDPYAIYARHILRLRALEPIGADPNTADYGNIVHSALEQFTNAYPGSMPDIDYAKTKLLKIGRNAFGELFNRPAVQAFWWPRFQRIADWFLKQEIIRRPYILPIAAEIRGSLTLCAPGGEFKITAIADRIDVSEDGIFTIIDYKTGLIPSEVDLKQGVSPQLPLEAAIAAAGGFPGISGEGIFNLSYWRVSGGREPGQIKNIKTSGDMLAEHALKTLVSLIKKFDDPSTAYLASPRPAIAPIFSDYDHLARIKEWSAGGPGDF